jgi:hypothetical protein
LDRSSRHTEDADPRGREHPRKQLNPYGEAKAVRAMLDRGLSEDGAAQALGWPKTRVTARVKILELPERAQQVIGRSRHLPGRRRPSGSPTPAQCRGA